MNGDFGLISIIMAAYNAEKTIALAVESVLAQTYTDFELIIINDCSSDGTRAAAEKYARSDERVILINNEKNLGVSLSRKKALENASGEWIAILDSDDAWMPDKLEKQIRLQQEKNADLVFCGASYIDKDGNKFDWELSVPPEIGYRRLLCQNVIHNPAALVRKTLYEKYYAVGDDMHEDFAMWLGILRSGVTAYAVTEPLITVRLSASSKSGNKLKSAVMNYRTYKYIGLGFAERAYYMCRYAVNGILKYRNFKQR